MKKFNDIHENSRLSASELNRLGAAVEKATNLTAEFPLEVFNSPGAVGVRFNDPVIWARITSKTSGSCATKKYGWVEVQLNENRVVETKPGGRSGTTTLDWAYEVNGRCVAIGEKVRLFPGWTGEWAFAAGAAAGGGGGDCASCEWLKDIKVEGCWTFYRRGGSGRCSCFPEDDPTDPEAGTSAVLDFELGGWLGVVSTDTPMITTCCGCGSGLLKVVNGIPTFTLGGVHVSCEEEEGGEESGTGSGSGPGANVFSQTITSYCCGILEDGRRFIEFFGYGADPCSGEREQCDNTFRIMAVCEGDCPAPNCNCEKCYDCFNFVSPPAYVAIGLGGFPSNHFNGDWIWSPDAEDPCKWVADCNGNVSTIEHIDGSPDKWRLTHGTTVYEILAVDWVCCGENTLTRVGGSGPDTLTVRAVGCDELDCYDHPDLTATVTIEGCDTQMVFTFAWNEEASPPGYEWVPETVVPGASACPATPSETYTGTLSCLEGDYQFGFAAPTGEGILDSLTLVSFQPFYATTSGTLVCGPPEDQSTHNVTVVITE